MEITTNQADDGIEIMVSGRLDAYWADHLTQALDEALHGGADRIRLNLHEVSFISSVGIRVLLKFYKQLQRIQGAFIVTMPSEAVRTVLELAGLDALLMPGDSVAPVALPGAAPRAMDRASAALEVYGLSPDAALRCQMVGVPGRLAGCRFGADDCRALRFPPGTFGLGLGAFGRDFDECQGRFGEFVAAAGTAAYLPTDGTNVPDYVVSAGALVPEVKTLYALALEGSFAQLLRFEARATTQAPAAAVSLAELADACLESVGGDAVGIVMVAESSGLIGAALRRSPALGGAATAPFAHPEIREWLSFTPERAYPHRTCLVVGVAARAAATLPTALEALLRPLGKGAASLGHFHAAAFSYRPLQKGLIELQPTVASLFEGETLQGVLHLLADDREPVGAGDSELVRGACWVAPITAISEPG